MIGLIPHTDPGFNYLKRIFGAKNGPRKVRLFNVQPRVIAACMVYEAQTGALEGVMPGNFGKHQRWDFLHCYSSRSTPLNELKASIRGSQTTEACQYCGINPASSLDHYLPRESFQEFSVYSSNLIPCCKDCNELKRAQWLVGGQRQIVNLYYDTIPATQFLQATVTPTVGSFRAVFNLSVTEAAYGGQRALIGRHFHHLKLLERYAAASRRTLPELRMSAQRNAQRHGEADAISALAQHAEDLKAGESRNYWRAVLEEAAAACPGFCTP